jgi:flagellar protein FliL
MSAEEKKHEEGAEESKGKGGVIPWIVVGMLSAGAGSAIPMMMSSHAAPAPEAEEKAHVEKKKKPAFELPKQEETICVPFGDGDERSVVVNLNDGRMNRYLKISIALQIPKSMEKEFPALLSSRRSELRNWCLGEIADKDLDDIRGMAGQNRLRRAIREHFNSVLFPDGYDQIYDVLFEEFYVQ